MDTARPTRHSTQVLYPPNSFKADLASSSDKLVYVSNLLVFTS
jgi:hypothetical protein